jgi:hypothetical protein
LDRFFVNSEASPDGHNWSTAAFSNDYVDKAFRWDYSGRGRTYDYEGFNRLPDYEPPSALPKAFRLPVAVTDVASYMQRFIPYLNGSRDVADPYVLNQVIWFSVRGTRIRMPAIAHLPAFDVMREGVADTDDDEREKTFRANKSANGKKQGGDED